MAPVKEKEIAEAKAFIQALRRQRGAEKADEKDERIAFFVKRLDKLVKVVSQDLYDKPTHFLLEVVQNADDNTYGTRVQPLLRFKLEGQYLQIDCNEVGFSKDNIAAICDVGESTKSSSMKSKGYIGEKGLGFKSVFKVAGTVWISSGPFAFKFEKGERLGMITPIWEEIPERFKGNFTQILLKITLNDNIKLVQNELESFDSSILIFLQKLRKIELSLPTRSVTISKHKATKFGGDALYLETTDSMQCPPAQKSQTYLLERYSVKNMPLEPKRPKISESEIVLAFPFSLSQEDPIVKTQCVHNFLPIGNYGFHFVIQADFLLTASRQGIHEQPEWNKRLVTEIASAFCQAIHRFNRNESKSFRYKWPMYLPQQDSGAASILKDLRDKILKKLCSTDCLEAQNGSFTKPSSLATIPSLYYGSAGSYLLDKVQSGDRFLSRLYVPTTVWQFKIREYTSAEFCEDLARFSREKFSAFKEMPQTWHCAVSKVLLTSLGNKDKLRSMPLIPLRDGSWIAATSGDIFADIEMNQDMKIPNGLEIFIVESSACADLDRRKLFEYLGVKRLNKSEICETILQRHQRIKQQSDFQWELSHFVEHAYYLFSASRSVNIRDLGRLWLVDHRKFLCERGDLYLEVPSLARPVSEHFGQDNRLIRLLHPDYFSMQDLNVQEWVNWLRHSLEIPITLRILRNQYNLSPEFDWLVSNKPNECLELMRDSSIVDARFLQIHGAKFKSRLIVECWSGKKDLIANVFLARSSITKMGSATKMLTFANLPDPENDSWLKFREIGLGVALNLRFYIEYLKNMHKEKCSVKQVADMYGQIEKLYFENPSSVTIAFGSFPLVFISKPQLKTSQWVKLSACRWKAPVLLTKVFALSERYSSCKTLFKDRLSLPDAAADDIIDELLSLENNLDQSDSIRRLLFELSLSLGGRKMTGSQLDRITGKRIFPTYDNVKQLSTHKDPWFIADRSGLERCFKGKLLLLDIEPHNVQLLQPLLNALGVSNWTLSGKVTEKAHIEGDVARNKVLTQNLRGKAIFFASLVSEGTRPEILSKFQNLELFATSKIVVERQCFIKTKSEERYVKGEDEEGDVVLCETDGKLQIYLSAQDVRSGDIPWGDLAERICEFCEMDESKMNLVFKILTAPRYDRIKANLEKNNLHVEHLFKQPKQFVSSKSEAQEVEDEIEDVDMEDNFDKYENVSTQTQAQASTSVDLVVRATSKIATTNKNAASVELEELDLMITDQEVIKAAQSARLNNNTHQSTISLPESSISQYKPERVTAFAQEKVVRSLRSRTIDISPGLPSKGKNFSLQGASHSETSSSHGFSSQISSPSRAAEPSTHSLLNQWTGKHNSALAKSYDFTARRRYEVLPSSNESDSSAQRLPVPRTKRELEEDQRIGYLGELYMFEIFRKEFGKLEFTSESWTSGNRSKAGFNDFTLPEMEYSDFTFVDNFGEFGKKFQLPLNTTGVTLHIEVKSTKKVNSEDPFHMSYHQQRLARQWSLLNQPEKQVKHLFIVIRVFSLNRDSEPQYRFYVDPWKQFIEDELAFQPEGAFFVFSTSTFSGNGSQNNPILAIDDDNEEEL